MEQKDFEKELNKFKINFTDGGVLIVLEDSLKLNKFKKIDYNGKYLNFEFEEFKKIVILPVDVNKLILSLKKLKNHEIFITNKNMYLENIINIKDIPKK